MTNQPLRRVDPLGRSAPFADYIPNDAWLAPAALGSAWPISRGSMRPIVDTVRAPFAQRARPQSPLFSKFWYTLTGLRGRVRARQSVDLGARCASWDSGGRPRAQRAYLRFMATRHSSAAQRG
jgi:hypothetical protein